MMKNKHFTKEDPWRIFRIMSEFVDGFETLSDLKKAVCIFGSARTNPNDKYFKLAVKTAHLFSKNGYSVITGAGNGIMEAANKGCYQAKGDSIGLNILIPINQQPNPFITRLLEFKYFFCRKVMFTKYSKALIVFPGGYGTLDEFSEAIALVQTERINPIPIVLVGKDYWEGLVEWFKNTLLTTGAIDKKDLNIFKVIDNPEEIVKYVKGYNK